MPAAGSLQCEIGEIGAGARRIERSFRDVPGRIDLDADGDANYTLNGSAGFFRDVGQNLIEDFAACE